jgi:hypothetical protein
VSVSKSEWHKGEGGGVRDGGGGGVGVMWVMTCDEGGCRCRIRRRISAGSGRGHGGVEPSERKKLHALIDSHKGGRSFTQWFF